MSKQWVMTYMPVGVNPDGNKLNCVYNAVGIDVLATEIAIYAGDTVPLYRQSEIKDAWKWLYEGVKSRNLLDGPFAGSFLYTGVNKDRITAAGRLTHGDQSVFDDDDIIIGIGADATTEGDKNFLEAAFQQLIEFAAEETLKAA